MIYRDRERVRKALAHEEPDRIPFCTFHPPADAFVKVLDSLNLDPDRRACYFEGDFRYVSFREVVDRATYLPYLPGLPADAAAVTDFGIGETEVFTAEGYVAGKKTWHPLAGIDTIPGLDAYPWPDMTDPRRHAHLDEEVRRAKAEGYTVIGQMSQTILENAYRMRGMEALFADFHERPSFVARLFEYHAERRRFQAKRLIEAGVDVLRIGDDIATQQGLIIGPALYREAIKPFHVSVVKVARDLKPGVPVLYHSDGNLTGLLPDLIDVGVSAINPAQVECMDLVAVKREFGSRLTLWGCLPTQSIFAHGTGDEVREYLRWMKRELAPGGGLVVEFYNALVTPVFLSNLRVFCEEFFDLANT
ncbi:MAG: uroporphyrinogen decarboxylase family protein [Candidatus Coatesbacteria bacterium]